MAKLYPDSWLTCPSCGVLLNANPKPWPAPVCTTPLLGHVQKCDFCSLQLMLLSAVTIWLLTKVEETVGGRSWFLFQVDSTAAFPRCWWYFYSLPQLMKFMPSSSKAVSEGVWGVGWLGGSSTHQQHMRECPLLPMSHLRCISSILHREDKITSSFHYLFHCFVNSKHNWKSKGVRRKRNKAAVTHQSSRWVRETNLETEGSVQTQYIRI